MSKTDRREFLKTIAQGSLALGIGMSFPGLTRSVFAQAAESPNPPFDAVEAALRQIKAEPWVKIDDRNVFLKGMAFDRKGNLTVVAAPPGPDPSKGLAGRLDRKVLSVSPDKKVTTLIDVHARITDHMIHKDGKMVIVGLDGSFLTANGDGTDVKPVTPNWTHKPRWSDLTYDSKGYLYVTDFNGKPGEPTGGVYRFSPDLKTCEPFVPNLVSPNGIAFSADEKTLWLPCSLAKQLVRVDLDDNKKVKKVETAYKLNGPGGDGVRTDIHGNLYLAMNFQGRILIFDKTGKPIAQVLMPGREKGELLSTTNVEFKPGTDEAYAVAAGETGGTWIYKFKGLAKGTPLYASQKA